MKNFIIIATLIFLHQLINPSNGQQDCKPFGLFQTLDSNNFLSFSWLTNSSNKCDIQLVIIDGDEQNKLIRLNPTVIKEVSIEDAQMQVYQINTQDEKLFQGLDQQKTYQYYVEQDDESKLKGTFRLWNSKANDVKLVFVNSLNSNSANSALKETLISSLDQQLRQNNDSQALVVDLTSQWMFINMTLNGTLGFLNDIQLLSMNYPYILLNQNESTIINQLIGTSKNDEYMRFLIVSKVQFLLVDTMFFIDGGLKINEKQKKNISQVLSADGDGLMMRIGVFDRPMYCSALSDDCTSFANIQKNFYQQQMIKNNVKLVINGGSETYERTYPKYEQKHQETEDPTYFKNPLYPSYINLNGLQSVKQENSWTLQKQQWSAFLRQLPTFGILSLNGTESLLRFNTYDKNGDEIDEVTIIMQPSSHHQIQLYAIYAFVIGILLFQTKVIYDLINKYAVFSKISKDVIKGIPFPVVEEDYHSHHQLDQQSPPNTLEGQEIELSDLTTTRNILNQESEQQESSASSEENNEEEEEDSNANFAN